MTSFAQLVPSAPEGRYDNVTRPYTPADVERLRGSIRIEYTLATHGANLSLHDALPICIKGDTNQLVCHVSPNRPIGAPRRTHS